MDNVQVLDVVGNKKSYRTIDEGKRSNRRLKVSRRKMDVNDEDETETLR